MTENHIEQKRCFIHDYNARTAIGRALAGAETYNDPATAAEKARRSRTGRNRVFALVITSTPMPDDGEGHDGTSTA